MLLALFKTLQEVCNVLNQSPYSELSQVVNKMPTRVHEVIMLPYESHDSHMIFIPRLY